jgi:archaellum component FlaF (FlaF/FlaG flagellin family)
MTVSTETINQSFQTIQTYLKNEEWVKSQSDDLITTLKILEETIEVMSTQIYVFIDYFQQYTQALEKSIIFTGVSATSNSDEYTSPTQTPVSVSLA